MVSRESTTMCLIHLGLLLYMVSERTTYVISSSLDGKGGDNATSSSPKGKTFTFATSPRPFSKRGKGDYSASMSTTTEAGMIVFPVEEEELPLRLGVKPLTSSSRHTVNAFSSCSKGKTICDRVDGYPRDRIEMALRTMGKVFQDSVDVDGLTVLVPLHPRTKEKPISPGGHDSSNNIYFPLEQRKITTKNFAKPHIKAAVPGKQDPLIFYEDKIDNDNGITNRLGNVEEYLCESSPQVMFLQAAENRDGAWKFIVNLNDKFRQGVRAELCSQRHKKCKYAADFPPNVTTRCEQKFIYRRLVAFDNDTVFNDNFKIPSCCVCVVTRTSGDSGERRSGDVAEPLALAASLVADEK